LLLLAAVCGSAFAGSTAKTPYGLYQALLTTAIPDSQLPTGHFSAKPGIGSLSSNSKSHHALGEVDVDIDDGQAAIVYEVFPSRALAVADFKAGRPNYKKIPSATVMTAPSRFPWPAVMVSGTVTGKNAFGKTVKNGTTLLAFTSKNVIVEAATVSTSNTVSGDVPGTIQLGDFALKHLSAVRR
jgi:hypothetical protein